MARSRNIKPAFFANELLGNYEPIISLLFAGLWCLADREGRLEDRPLRINAELFPYRYPLDINGYLTVLERDGFVVRYVVNGIGYIQVQNFVKHQSPHHTEKSKNLPPPPNKKQDSECKGALTPLSDGDCKVPERSDLLIPDSLIPDLPASQPDALAMVVDNSNKCAMYSRWFPSTDLIDNLPFTCLSAPIYENWKNYVGEFCTYWMTKPEISRTDAEWDKAFLECLMFNQNRTDREMRA